MTAPVGAPARPERGQATVLVAVVLALVVVVGVGAARVGSAAADRARARTAADAAALALALDGHGAAAEAAVRNGAVLQRATIAADLAEVEVTVGDARAVSVAAVDDGPPTAAGMPEPRATAGS